MSYYRQHQLPVVVLRPGFIYGPRDRTLMPKMLENLRKRKVRYIVGASKRAMNCIYVGNLIEAALLAAEKPEAIGQIYNLTDGEFVSKRRFIDTIVEGMGLPRPKPVPVPLWAGRIMAWWMEGQARKKNSPKAPRVTQGRLKLFGLNLDFSIEKAKNELGYRPRWSFEEGMRETVAWYKQNA
jgi:nucleoside-diphosphate-sugar epimerase